MWSLRIRSFRKERRRAAPVWRYTGASNAPWVLNVGASRPTASRQRRRYVGTSAHVVPAYLEWAAADCAPDGTVSRCQWEHLRCTKARSPSRAFGTGFHAYLRPERHEHGAPGRFRPVAMMCRRTRAHAQSHSASIQYPPSYPGYDPDAGPVPQCHRPVRLANSSRRRSLERDPTELWARSTGETTSDGRVLCRRKRVEHGTDWAGSTDRGDNLVWGTSAAAWRQHVWGTAARRQLVWGTRRDNMCGARPLTKIVWALTRRNIYGAPMRVRLGQLVWGTGDDGNIVWGTRLAPTTRLGHGSRRNIVWGTAKSSPSSGAARRRQHRLHRNRVDRTA